MSGRTVADGESLREWPLFVYFFELRAEHIHIIVYQVAADCEMHLVTLFAFHDGARD
jgi:hypothetical protein